MVGYLPSPVTADAATTRRPPCPFDPLDPDATYITRDRGGQLCCWHGNTLPPIEPSSPPPSTGWGLAGFVLVALVALVLVAALAIVLARLQLSLP